MDRDQRLRLSHILQQLRAIGDERVALIEKRLAMAGGPLPEAEVREWRNAAHKRQCSRSSPIEERHEAIKAYFDNEAQLRNDFGDGIVTFEVYRSDLGAASIRELQGEVLAEIRYPGAVITGYDTVSIVEELLRLRLAELAAAQPALHLGERDNVTFFLSGQPMDPASLFYAENFILLPVWVQCGLHACSREVLLQADEPARIPP